MAYFLTPTTNARQILTNSVETLSVTAYSDETPAQADGAVTLGIVDSAGNIIVAAGTGATGGGAGVYKYILPAQTEPKQHRPETDPELTWIRPKLTPTVSKLMPH